MTLPTFPFQRDSVPLDLFFLLMPRPSRPRTPLIQSSSYLLLYLPPPPHLCQSPRPPTRLCQKARYRHLPPEHPQDRRCCCCCCHPPLCKPSTRLGFKVKPLLTQGKPGSPSPNPPPFLPSSPPLFSPHPTFPITYPCHSSRLTSTSRTRPSRGKDIYITGNRSFTNPDLHEVPYMRRNVSL